MIWIFVKDYYAKLIKADTIYTNLLTIFYDEYYITIAFTVYKVQGYSLILINKGYFLRKDYP